MYEMVLDLELKELLYTNALSICPNKIFFVQDKNELSDSNNILSRENKNFCIYKTKDQLWPISTDRDIV